MNIFRYFLLVFFIVCLSSCSMENNDSLEDRAIARWYSLIDKDWQKAYLYESPGYRNTHPVDRFKNGFGLAVEWNSVEFVSVDYINKSAADVNLVLNVTYNGNIPVQTPLKERWIHVDSKWWHVSKD